jgi:hypothetical protein
MKNPQYWKKHYVVETDVVDIERSMKVNAFTSGGEPYELVCFETNKQAPNILISPGSGGHAYVFAELGYRMYLRGYNVFIMPKHGGLTITELMPRHRDALNFIAKNFNDRIGVFAEGLGGYTMFYLSLAGSIMKSAAYQNAPVVMNEPQFHEALKQGDGSAQRRRLLLPLVKFLHKILPWIKIPIRLYLDFEEMVDSKAVNRKIEAPMIDAFGKDIDFDQRYPLSAIMSLVTTPPPRNLATLQIPTMMIVPARGFFPAYQKDLFHRLPTIHKKLIEVDGGVFWMVSHPAEAAEIICNWFDETID